MDSMYSSVTEQSDKNLRRQKRNYDKRTNDETFTVGQFVWLRNDSRKKGVSPKLTNRWDGPFRVITKLSNVTYRIQRSPRTPQKIVHYDRLKLYEGPKPDVWNKPSTQRTDMRNGIDKTINVNRTCNDHITYHYNHDNKNNDNRTYELDRRYPNRNRRPPTYFY